MPELPYTALPTPATPIGDLKSWRLILRCAKCNMKVVLALTDIARTHGAALPVWRATDREASKVRLLAMAADYEVRAEVAHGLVEPPLGDEIKVQTPAGVKEFEIVRLKTIHEDA